MKNNEVNKCYECKNFYLTTGSCVGNFVCKNKVDTEDETGCENFEERTIIDNEVEIKLEG